VAIVRPLSTELITPTAERVRVPNSIVLRRQLVVHGNASPPIALTTTVASVATTMAPTLLLASPTDAPTPAQPELIEPAAGNTAMTQPVDRSAPALKAANSLTQPLSAGNIPPLRKRQGLGAASIKGLMRA